MSSSGMAAQLTCTSAPFLRGDWRWMARATSSLPVPLSPVMSTVAGVGAARSIISRTRRIGGAVAHQLLGLDRRAAAAVALQPVALDARSCSDSSTRSRCSGFSKKS